MTTSLMGDDSSLDSLIASASNLFKKDGSDKANVPIDYKKLAETGSQFAKTYVTDYAKKEQDQYESPTARDQKDGNSTILGQTIGAVAGMAICTALGAPNPICGVVGGMIGGLVQGLFSFKPVQISAEAERLMDNLKMDKKANDKRRNAQQMGLCFEAYGRNRMEGLVDIVNCIKEKAILGKKPDGTSTDEIYHWVPYSLKNSDYKRYNESLYYAMFYVSSDEPFNDVNQRDKTYPNWLNDAINYINLHTETDKRCFNDSNSTNVALGLALCNMWKEKIRTPSAVRRYASYYDDGQVDQHKAILDPCSKYYDELDKQNFANKTGKPVVCKNKDGEKETTNPFTLNNILKGAAIGLGVGMVYKLATKK